MSGCQADCEGSRLLEGRYMKAAQMSLDWWGGEVVVEVSR
jgi:hypothetical protein